MPKKEIFGDTELDEDGISSLMSLTQQVFIELERELKLAGFWESIPARNKLRADIQKTLLQREFSKLPRLVRCIPIKRKNASRNRTLSDIRMSR
jgi:type I restriction enzyme R subunit